MYPHTYSEYIINDYLFNRTSIIGIPTFNNGVIDKLYLYKGLLYLDNSEYIENLVSQGYVYCPAPVYINDTIVNNASHVLRRFAVESIIDTDVAYIDFSNYTD